MILGKFNGGGGKKVVNNITNYVLPPEEGYSRNPSWIQPNFIPSGKDYLQILLSFPKEPFYNDLYFLFSFVASFEGREKLDCITQVVLSYGNSATYYNADRISSSNTSRSRYYVKLPAYLSQSLSSNNAESLGYRQGILTIVFEPNSLKSFELDGASSINFRQLSEDFSTLSREVIESMVINSVKGREVKMVTGGETSLSISLRDYDWLESFIYECTVAEGVCNIDSFYLYRLKGLRNVQYPATTMFTGNFVAQSCSVLPILPPAHSIKYLSLQNCPNLRLFPTKATVSLYLATLPKMSKELIPALDFSSLDLWSIHLQELPLEGKYVMSNLSPSLTSFSFENMHRVTELELSPETRIIDSGFISYCSSLKHIKGIVLNSAVNGQQFEILWNASLLSGPFYPSEYDFYNYNTGIYMNCPLIRDFGEFDASECSKEVHINGMSSLEKLCMNGMKYSVHLQDCNLDATELNRFFENLGTAVEGATLYIKGNRGADTCNPEIATAKGFTVDTTT